MKKQPFFLVYLSLIKLDSIHFVHMFLSLFESFIRPCELVCRYVNNVLFWVYVQILNLSFVPFVRVSVLGLCICSMVRPFDPPDAPSLMSGSGGSTSECDPKGIVE
jgi:hypothetical protein